MRNLAFTFKATLTTGLIFLTLFCMLLTSCNLNNPFPPASSNTSTSNGNAVGPGVQGVHIFIEPAAGDSIITGAIAAANKSIWLEIYLLTDRKILNALESAAHRGIDVHVLLEPHPYGSSSLSSRETVDKLLAAGARAQSTNPTFALTHAKTMLIDNTTAYIMTCNFTLSALGSSKQTLNREYGITDTNPQDVQAIGAIFTADWNRINAQFNAPNLVVSPENSRNIFTTLINSANKTLMLEAEEMQDSSIEQALINAARRGVQVQIILPTPANPATDSNSTGITAIKQGGVQVKEDPHLYMHAKVILVDGQKAFVGSENISTASLDSNRELGILVADQPVLLTLQETFQQDWSDSNSI